MKTQTLIFTICAAFSLVFFGCEKKQASAEAKTDASSESEIQSEPAAIAQETQLAKDEFDTWNDEDKFTIKELINHPIRTDAFCTPGELDKAGLYMFTYIDGDNVRSQITLAPVIFASNSAKPALEKYPSFKRTDYSDMRVVWYASSAASAMAFHEKDTPSNLITILYSTDKWKTWNEAHIEGDSDFLDENKEPRCILFCADSNTGYLLLGRMETVVVNGSHSGKTVPGAHIFRTQDAGVSWQELGEIKPSLYDHFFVKEDGTLDTERYSAVPILGFCFEGKYGIIRFSYQINDEDVRKSGYFATKDGGKSWIVWDK